MTKEELDRRVREILDSKTKRTLRNNKVIVNTEDIARILGKTLRDVQHEFGRWDTYTLEVIRKTSIGYILQFPGEQIVEMEWGGAE